MTPKPLQQHCQGFQLQSQHRGPHQRLLRQLGLLGLVNAVLAVECQVAVSIVGQQGTTIHIDAPTTIDIDDPMAALQQSEVLHFTFLTMMNSDVSNAAASHSRGPTPGSMGDVSELSCPESGLGLQNFHQQNSFSDFGFDMQVFQQRSS
jgi:hypothetical protein